MKYLFFGLLLGGCGLDSMNASDTGSATFGELSISPSTMDFGYVAPGESATDTFVIANLGGDPIALRGLGVVGSTVFNVTTTTQVPPALEKGDEIVLSVEFSPTGYEDYEAALAIQTDMPGLEYIERPILGTGLLQGLMGELDRDVALQTAIHGAPDFSHAPLAYEASEGEASVERPSSLAVERVCHAAILPAA